MKGYLGNMRKFKIGDKVILNKVNSKCGSSGTCSGIGGPLHMWGNGKIVSIKEQGSDCYSHDDGVRVWKVEGYGNWTQVCERAMERVEWIEEKLWTV